MIMARSMLSKEALIQALNAKPPVQRYAAAEALMVEHPDCADALGDWMDDNSWFDELDDDSELASVASRWKQKRRLAHDIEGEVEAIVRDGMRGYLQNNGVLTVVHRSAKQPGWWQATVYNVDLCTINSDTQHATVEDIFGVLGADICPRSQPLQPAELEPVMQTFLAAATSPPKML